MLTLKGASNTILVSFIGYQNSELKVTGDKILASLKPLDNNLGVVVIGYQQVELRKTTGAITSVKGKEFENTPYATFDVML